MSWKQPDPTKRYAVFYDGAWYGEGDTPEAAWAGVRRQLSPQHDRYGATLFAKIKRAGKVQETAAFSGSVMEARS